MAHKRVTILRDDLTGKILSDGAGETVLFGLDGNSYEIDIDTKGAEKLRGALATYIAAARRVSGTRSSRIPRVKSAPDPGTVRAWAAAQGIQVGDRGRLPASVVAQFEAAGF
ncbi:MAG: hypothetical protein QOI06_2867 [Nocardioidaceae bacterium]|jgi:hypothetical protein|nr:hypothetical protein [Nocardioidaceae bacterium]